MAKVKIIFIDEFDKEITSRIENLKTSLKINISDEEGFKNIVLDKSTAIRFAKTLRTEINKIVE